jgi:hypothetical protein
LVKCIMDEWDFWRFVHECQRVFRIIYVGFLRFFSLSCVRKTKCLKKKVCEDFLMAAAFSSVLLGCVWWGWWRV